MASSLSLLSTRAAAPSRRRVLSVLALAPLSASLPALAHDFKAGAVRIDHPYAPPSLAGQSSAAVYLRGLRIRALDPDCKPASL